MGRKLSLVIEVRKDDANKRTALCQGISVALMLNDIRVTSGVWRVTLEKLPKQKGDE